ncbi:hypothetical protein [Paraburkholderia humisilvae]|nr:hypothetical protein [Paraburkholderia humisilvae]
MARTTLRLVWTYSPVVASKLLADTDGATQVQSDIRSTAVAESARQIPYFLVLRAGHECYVLDVHRGLIRRGASQLLKVFARRHSIAQALDEAVWDAFSSAHEFSAEERATRCMFSLVAGRETPHQLELLTML